MERKLITVVLLLILGTFAQALYVTTEFGNGADSYISNDTNQSSTANMGTEVRMRARTSANSRFKAIFLKFDISEITDPFEADTRLLMHTTFLKGGAKTLNIYGLADSETDDNWIESGTGGICYANAPGFVTPQVGDNGATVAGNNLGNYAIDARLSLLGTITSQSLTAGEPVGLCWSVNGSSLADFLNLDTNNLVTLVLIAQGNSEVEWASSENTTYQAPALVPEPATLSILGLGAMMFIRRKK